MITERYEGEKRGLSLFLEDLLPFVEERLGDNSMLTHAIRRALHSGNLKQLRHARELFNALPRPERRQLSLELVSQGEDDQASIEEVKQPQPVICFETDGRRRDGSAKQHIELHLDHQEVHAVRVMVKPGTLPSTASQTLREIADMIDGDRRLLSQRHWRTSILCLDSSDNADFG